VPITHVTLLLHLEHFLQLSVNLFTEQFKLGRTFYRAMHYSAKRGIAIACRLSVRLSVRPSVCNVRDSGPHKLEISETNCTDN